MVIGFFSPLALTQDLSLSITEEPLTKPAHVRIVAKVTAVIPQPIKRPEKSGNSPMKAVDL